MRTFNALLLTGAVALAVPGVSNAADPNKALDACVKTFVQTTLPQGQPVTVRKASYVPSPLDSRRSQYTIELVAKSKKSGETVSRAKCVAKPQGYVILLDTKAPDVFFAG